MFPSSPEKSCKYCYEYTIFDESAKLLLYVFVFFLQIAELTVIPTGSTIQSHGMPCPVNLSDK